MGVYVAHIAENLFFTEGRTFIIVPAALKGERERFKIFAYCVRLVIRLFTTDIQRYRQDV